MEKISIARRRLEKKKAAVYVKNKPNDSPSDTSCSHSGENYSPPVGSCPPQEAGCSPQEAGCSPQEAGYSSSEAGCSPQEAGYSSSEADYSSSEADYSPQEAGSSPSEAGSSPSEAGSSSPVADTPPPEISNSPQQTNTAVLQTPPVYSLDSLISLINEEGGLLELGKKQFTLEIVSGVEKPIKMLVSIHPVNENSNSPGKGKSYEEGYMTPEEAAQTLKVSKNTIYRQLKEGSLKGLKIGCRWRVLLSPQGKTEGSERGNG